jgi:hypothetical protein
VEPEGDSEPAVEPEGDSEPAAEPEADSEPAVEPEAAEPSAELAAEPTAEPEAAEPQGDSEPAVEPEGEPPPPPPPPATKVIATLTLAGDVETVAGAEGSAERATFETAFKDDVAATVGVSVDQIAIVSITAASVEVVFEVLPTSSGESVDASAVQTAFSDVVALPTVGVSTTGSITTTVETVEDEAEPEAQPEAEPVLAAQPEVEAEAEAAAAEPEVQSEAEVEPQTAEPHGESEPEGTAEPEDRAHYNSWDVSMESEPESADVEPAMIFIWAPTGLMYTTTGIMFIMTYFRGRRLATGDVDVQTLLNSDRSQPPFFSTEWWDRRFMQKSAIMMDLTHQGTTQAPARISATMTQHYRKLFPVIKTLLPGLFSALVAPALMTWRDQLSQLVFP